jgi:hypothetical protein
MVGTTRLLVVLLVIFTAAPGCAAGDPPRKPSARVSGDLLALHESYRAAQSRGEELQVERSNLRILGDRVLIDAVAAGDPRVLEADLVALGLRHPAAFGRVVSGEFPIAAIPRLQSLASLALARPSTPSRGPTPRPALTPR